ncbi:MULTISPECIES: acetyl/propionyl/methylcrotonyl-CoA carboxylase subunit alpha [unclassified Bacillus (in: firmicutes)]|uniref:acetyl-CoA carboxylase biotin carboxylase subunit n=1 Tax=unclassified Bacillus (in: firmicutes) TaxID=185979 RepID=UPI0008F0A06D|nr:MULTISPECIES: acetyl-CoA carboxylase biotin carboxylase subunit [unclassified Bacillus (in: firmicutes)]SFA75668.1 acetyl-CoA carboxylase, biotin carboxylase subunit [Bacillus sp. UNCCL13]SFQ65749.1 acetyl-CoA carboxylase, biotin carboxylase subunit [Bacillus sp. cl95]
MQKILVANRGEIALRIIKTCNEMGIETVAIYSDADHDMPFVKAATKSVRIGEAPVMKSYLRADAILEVAKNENVDGIHPGYGFLSENYNFAKLIEQEGITFIGPAPETIEMMGDKIVSRRTMLAAGVPVVPGTEDGVLSLEEACEIAESMGYPVMLKASGGGGGIGMVRCENEQALAKSFDSTKARAKAYFGSEEVFIEKYIANARHVEVQVFGDKHGNIVHLFERDCSIQRRHQKVIEESPSPFLSDKTRQKMFETAILAAKAVNYFNAGTIEFIVDEEENFYFLEMNTRLQVEHPVTEQISGLDLVKWQILVARGEKLPLLQSELDSTGHAIEFRLYAEDPVKFMPSPGKINVFSYKQGEGIRIDNGYDEGGTVSPFYDPMISKCIFHAPTRKEALNLADDFFKDLKIEGIKTNVPLFLSLLEDEDFQNGLYTTSFLNERLTTKS